MRYHRSPRPQSSRSSSPRVAIEVSRSPALTLIGIGALISALSTCLSVALTGAPIRGLSATTALAFAVRPSLLIFGLSPDSVRRFEWTSDGHWHIQKAAGAWQRVELLQSTTILGPLVLLVWRGPARRRSYLLLDTFSTGAYAFRLLRGRLRLEAGGARRAVDNYC